MTYVKTRSSDPPTILKYRDLALELSGSWSKNPCVKGGSARRGIPADEPLREATMTAAPSSFVWMRLTDVLLFIFMIVQGR